MGISETLSYIWAGGEKANINSIETFLNPPSSKKVSTGIVPIGSMAKSVWGGLGTTGKVLVGAGAGAGAYATYNWLFGSKKESAPQEQKMIQQQQPIITPVITQTPIIIQPSDQRSWQYDCSTQTNIISDSPGARIDSKKSMSIEPSAAWSTPFSATQPLEVDLKQEGSQSASQGTDFTTIAIIAAVGLVAYGFVNKEKKHGK